MIYKVSANNIQPFTTEMPPSSSADNLPDQWIAFVSDVADLPNINELIQGPLVRDAKESATMFFENHSAYDFIAINVPNIKSTDYGSDKISVFLNLNFLLFYSEDEEVLSNIDSLTEALEYKLSNKRSYYSEGFILNKIFYN